MFIMNNQASGFTFPKVNDHQIEDTPLKRGLNIPLRSSFGKETTLVDRYCELPNEVTFKGRVYVKVHMIHHTQCGYCAHYWAKGSKFPEGFTVSDTIVSHTSILAEYLFGITHAGLDTYLAEFGKFIGVHLDSNNMRDYLHAFAAYLSKELEVSPSTLRVVVRYIMHLK